MVVCFMPKTEKYYDISKYIVSFGHDTFKTLHLILFFFFVIQPYLKVHLRWRFTPFEKGSHLLNSSLALIILHSWDQYFCY